MILYLLTGLLIGAAFVYILLKLSMQQRFVPRAEFDEKNNAYATLQLENASRLSKQEVEQKFVSKELHENIAKSLEDANQRLESANNTVLKLTAESKEKLSKTEVETNYVAKETFDIINNKLSDATIALQKKDQEIKELSNQVTAFQKQEEHLNDKVVFFNKELEKLHNLSQEKFKNLASEILEEKKKNFVSENRRELHTILDPLKTNLDEFRKKVEDTRKEDIQDITSLKKEIESLNKLNNQLSEDAKNLATALKSEVKMQGNWGEDRLNMILEVEGLQKYIDYTREEMYRDDEQDKNRKPDFILKLPNGRCIIIDSKVSLTAYVNYFNASTADEKVMYLKQHLKSVTDHIDKLADKNYQTLAGLTTPDYVFMFMPVESALTLALNQNPEIFNNALKRKVVLITPTTLVATLKVVKILWQKENQVKNVEEIFKQCGELYNKFVSFLEDMDKIESALHSATQAHKSAMNSLKEGTRKGNTIIGRFETIRRLEAKTSKLIPEKHLREIDLLPEDQEIVVLDTGNQEQNELPERDTDNNTEASQQ
jgi:DNA recombination protein RmuC